MNITEHVIDLPEGYDERTSIASLGSTVFVAHPDHEPLRLVIGEDTMGKRENKVETYFDDEVKKLGGETRKFVSPGRAGVTDRIAILPGGVVWFVEVKTVDGELSPMQEREIKNLRKLGCNARSAFGKLEVDQLLSDMKASIT